MGLYWYVVKEDDGRGGEDRDPKMYLTHSFTNAVERWLDEFTRNESHRYFSVLNLDSASPHWARFKAVAPRTYYTIERML